MKRILENILLSARPKSFGILCASVALVFNICLALFSAICLYIGFGPPVLQAFNLGWSLGFICFWWLVIIEMSKE